MNTTAITAPAGNEEIYSLGNQIAALTAVEAQELIDYLKNEYGIKAPASIQTMLPSFDQVEKKEEQTEFAVVLESFGEKKISVIKVLRHWVSGLSLMEAKKLVESAPTVIKEDVSKEEAEDIKTAFEEAGGSITIK